MISNHIKKELEKTEEKVIDNKNEANNVDNEAEKSTSQIKETRKYFSSEEYMLEMENDGKSGLAAILVNKFKYNDETEMVVRVEGAYTKEEWVDIAAFIKRLSKNE